MIINHVMSSDMQSGIFDDIINYYKMYSYNHIKNIVSVKPIAFADVYHYHRPHLERQLMSPSVCTIHHDLNDLDPWLQIENFIPKYRESTAVICLNSLQNNILSKYNIFHTHIIPHGYNDNIIKANKKIINVRKIKILISSKRYGRRVKGEGYLLELLKFLDPKQIEFLLVGEGRSQDLGLFNRYGFNVKIYEYIPYRLFGNLYNSVDFLLMVSFFEGGPANIPEAVASGTPVICNPIGMAYDMITDGFNGIYLTMDPYVDGNKLNYIFSSKKDVEMYFNNAISLYSLNKAITWRESIQKNNDIYKEILK